MMDTFKTVRTSLVLATCGLLFSCGAISSKLNFKIVKETPGSMNFEVLKYSKAELELVCGGKTDASCKNRPEWGLALSGGGIRSSAYALGVMKSLYDRGILEKIDMISAVSGGGYALYWLATSTLNNPKPKNQGFAYSAFSDSPESENFLLNTCNFMNNADFATYQGMAKALVKRDKLSEFYRCKIERTYGWNDKSIPENQAYKKCLENPSKSIKIGDFSDLVKDGSFPYFVFNTTLVSPSAEEGWNDGLYEFTPIHRGNDKYGYAEIGTNSLPLSQVAAISGAAVKPLLKQQIPNSPLIHPKIDKNYIELSDGGHSENLGVIALVKRGTRNIIVSDAELDPDLTFEGYYILKDRLEASGLELINSDLDSRAHKAKGKKWWNRDKVSDIPEGNFVAQIYKKGDRSSPISTLYYIKMSILGKVTELPQHRIFESHGLSDCDNSNSRCLFTAKELYEPESSLTQNALICDTLNQVRKKNGSCQDIGYKDCELLTGKGFNPTSWISQNAILRIDDSLDRVIDKNFPSQSTIDQSFYLDQFTAYMGLGYIQTNLANFDEDQKGLNTQ